MRLIKEKTNINFLGASRRKAALGISAFVVIVSLVSFFTHDPPLEFGIDFTGGILLEVGYPDAADIEGIRGNLEAAGFDDAQVQLRRLLAAGCGVGKGNGDVTGAQPRRVGVDLGAG